MSRPHYAMFLRAHVFAVLLVLAGTVGCSVRLPFLGQSSTGCRSDEYSASVERIGVKRSTDRGATWIFLGHACFHATRLIPVDPSPLRVENGIALYFLDLATNQTPGQTRVIYRATTTDGLEFTTPQVAYSTADPITDPFVLRMPAGGYRMYLDGKGSILSASSADGITFTSDGGVRTRAGGVPGALLLPTGEIRLFVSGGGIRSVLSRDGLNFVEEPGVRIPSDGRLVADPHPIQLSGDGYVMIYKIVPSGGRTPQDDIALLATSADGLNWVPGAASIARGSVPAIVESADGSLLLYYVDFNY